MTTTDHRPQHRNGLYPQHQPRPWHCTTKAATFCPVHGDCRCPSPQVVEAACPLHGAGTAHPSPTPTLVR